ncbi:MAG: hypothetical protein LBV72_00545 [Tannerella sp.]|jgi:hypothetical protein|nr:hypothetical protein [Tannerella sp.]
MIVRFLLTLWQLPQLIVGEAIYAWHKLFLRKRYIKNGFACCDSYKYTYSKIDMYSSKRSRIVKAFSLGRRIFLYYDKDYHDKAKLKMVINEVVRHEYGHSIQSARRGLFYLWFARNSLLVTGISSGLAEKIPFEKKANKLVENKNIKITY